MSQKKKQNAKPSRASQKPAEANSRKYWPWIAVAVVILFVGAIRIRLLQVPLERDEGEFAYMGQLMLQGIPPYVSAYNMKLPGTYAAYALLMAIFGQTIAGIHIGLLLVNATAIVLAFLLTRRLFGNAAGVVASASYALLSLSPSVLGTSAHATQFIVPLVLGGTILLLRALDSGRRLDLLFSGLLFGLAFLMKQHAVFFLGFAMLYFLYVRIRTRPLDLKRLAIEGSLLGAAISVPFAVSCVWLYVDGSFSKFWFWTFQYGAEYISEVSFSDAARIFAGNAWQVIRPCKWIWAIAAVGLTAMIWNKDVRAKWPFLGGMAVFSFLSICPGFYFRNHYFVTLLPIISILAGIGVSAMLQLFPANPKRLHPGKVFSVLIFAAAFTYSVYMMHGFLFQANPVRASRMMYGISPFPESIEIAQYIRKHTTRNDTIAVFGSEPQIFFYSHRKSATGYIYVYALREIQGYAARMQQEFIEEIQKSRPKYVVMVNVANSWFNGKSPDDTIFVWARSYFGTVYKIAGLLNILPNGDYHVYWGEQARKIRPNPNSNLYILERIKE